jgi:uncharacterized protein
MEKDKPVYYKFSAYLRERFGCPVYKVSIDAGFSCPNKDGKLSTDGCIYCDNKGFSLNTRQIPRPTEIQIQEGMDFGRTRFKAQKFIVYFQAYTNTYAPVTVLKEKYDVIRKFKDVVGLSIGTRPDCINDEILDLIETYTSDYEVWLEYGLQTIHQKTLDFINRRHTYEDFINAVKLTRKRKNIKICTHVIIGLPGESKEDMMATARVLGKMKLEGIKIHPLHIIKGTKLEKSFQDGTCKPLELEEYVDLAAGFLEYLWPQTVIQRLTADCPWKLLVAPLWLMEKNKVLKDIEQKMLSDGQYQGRKQ